jgi:hypothetical protein
MRSQLLITSAAALLAGTMFAAGQGMPQGGSPGSQAPTAAPGGQMDKGSEQGKPRQGQHPQGQIQTQGQPPAQGQRQPQTSGQGQREQGPQGQNREEQRPRERSGTQGQGQPREQGQAPQDQQRQGQGQNREEQREQGQGPRQGAQEQGRSGASLSTEQRTKIREVVLKRSDAPRVTNVDFSIRVGTAVPRTVRFVEVPDELIVINPQWRGYRYFIVNDQIVIVEPDTLKIVAVLDV